MCKKGFYLRRFALDNMAHWFTSKGRRPLVVRGARQVGKSTLVRMFAAENDLDLLEINLERHLYLDQVFEGLRPATILSRIEEATGRHLTPKTLLFLDEIQATPYAFGALRYFYEDHPDLPVVAAGSLLELALPKIEFSMPVGRIEYLHLGACTFPEFLVAADANELHQRLTEYRVGDEWSEVLDRRCAQYYADFLAVGGMPAALASFIDEPQNTAAWRQAQQRIMDTYQDDFAKYRSRGDWAAILQQVYRRLPGQVGRKVKYTELAPGERVEKIHQAVDMLIAARVVMRASHVAPPTQPLAAHASAKVYKTYWVDGGLVRLDPAMAAEQFVAQHLAYGAGPMIGPELYYWLREGKTENAEVDFVINIEADPGTARTSEVIPLEVKSGATGKIRSLRLYIEKYKPRRAVRLHAGLPAQEKILATNLITLPVYMAPYLNAILSALST